MDFKTHIASFTKYNRNKLQWTQEELAQKAGVGLRFIRDLEQGKNSLRMDKVNQILQLFGYELWPGSQRKKDPFEILMNHFNRNVHVYLKNGEVLVGYLVSDVRVDNEVKGWQFVSNNNNKEYQQTLRPNLLIYLEHSDIENIENI